MVKIPRFRTEEEMREFWDTHDSSKYFEDMGDDEVRLHLNDKDWLELSESAFVFWDNEEDAYYDYLWAGR